MDTQGTESSNDLSPSAAADSFDAFVGGEVNEDIKETPEAAAERLAAQEAAEKNSTEDAGADNAEKFTIEVDGKEIQLTKAEMADHYKNGLRQADYTRKTMEASDTRKAADAEIQKTRQERADYATKLQNYAIQMQGGLQEMSQVNLQELLQNDPVAYLEHTRIAQERQANLSKAEAELNRVRQEHRAEQEHEKLTYQAQQLQELHAKLPDWKDQAKARTEIASIKEYLATQGFSADKISSITDAADIIVHRKAMLYDSLIERAGKAVKKVAALPTKVERPGTVNNDKPKAHTEAMKRLTKSGSIADAANAFDAFV